MPDVALQGEVVMAPRAIPGADQSHVVAAVVLAALAQGETHPQAARALTWWQRLALALARLFRVSRHAAINRCWLPRGRQVCVIGGNSAGLTCAQLLCERGRKVSVVTAEADFGADVNPDQRSTLLASLRQRSAVLINHSRVRCIDKGTLVLDCDCADIDIPADLVVLSEEAQ